MISTDSGKRSGEGSSSGAGGEGSLRVLAMNVWGLPAPAISFVYPNLRPDPPSDRIRHLALERLGDFDLAIITECWQQRDRDTLAEIARERHGLRFFHHFHSGVFGSGVVVVSRHPITETHFHRFRVSGRPSAVFHGDWYAGRGCGMAVIDATGPGGLGTRVTVFASHLHAQYSHEDTYEAHRTAQARDFARFVELARPAAQRDGGLVIVAGDFNLRPSSLAYEVLRGEARLGDAWTDALLSNAHDPGFTIHEDIERPVRIDYVLYGCGKGSRVELEWSKVVMQGWHGEDTLRTHPVVVATGGFYDDDPGLDARGAASLTPQAAAALARLESRDRGDSYFYSDHFGVAAYFSTAAGAPSGLPARCAASLSRLRTRREIAPQLQDTLSESLCGAVRRQSRNLRSAACWAAVSACGAWASAAVGTGKWNPASMSMRSVALASAKTTSQALLSTTASATSSTSPGVGVVVPAVIAVAGCAVPLVMGWLALWNGVVEIEEEIRALREMMQELTREAEYGHDDDK